MSSHSSSNLKENIEDIVIDEDRLKMIYENTIYNGTLEEFHEYVKNKIKEGDLFAVYLFKVWDGREESSAEDENEKENQEKTTTDEDEDENKDCENCVNCKESKNCKDCESCVACVNCVKCKHSPGCEDCVRCERCSDMNYCGICEDCEHCARCKKCYECENCVDCEHCTNCHYCWGLKRGRDLWGNTMTKDEWEALDEKKQEEIEDKVLYIQNECVNCVESLTCKKCVDCIWCRDCEDCEKCEGCRKCYGCKHCIACEYLENAENMICSMPLEEWKKLTKKEKVNILEQRGVDAELRAKCLKIK